MKKLLVNIKSIILSAILSLPLLGGAGGGLSLLLLTSCSENDDTVEEFANWQETNEKKVDDLYAKTKNGNDPAWRVIRNWSMPTDGELGYTEKAKDCIIVNVLEEGTGIGTPIYTDSVRCHYEGRLLPSTTYTEGYVFDQSFYGNFDTATAKPAKFVVSGLVDGFTTALMNMHPGDHWRVYIPYQLGYGVNGSGSSIPGYSTLVFDIRLVDYWAPKR